MRAVTSLAVSSSFAVLLVVGSAAAHGDVQEPEHETAASKGPEGPAEELPYVAGEPAKAGYHLDRRPREGMLTGGIVLFAASWIPGLALAGGCLVSECRGTRHGWETVLAVPFAGPLVYSLARCAGTHEEGCYFGSPFWIADAAVQIGGFALFMVGAKKRELWVRNDVALDLRPLSFGRSSGGLALVGSF
jgi:hypothetical protein